MTARGQLCVLTTHTGQRPVNLLALGKLSTLSKPYSAYVIREGRKGTGHISEYLLQNEPVWIFPNQHLKMRTFTKPLEDVLYTFLIHCLTTSLYIISGS